MDRVYLDHSATTPLRPEVREAMLPFLGAQFGNPGSLHWFGRQACHALEDAREMVAAFIGAESREIIFTSGGTEANNLAISSISACYAGDAPRLALSAVEHPSVLRVGPVYAERAEIYLNVLPVDAQGRVTPETLRRYVNPNTVLLSLMFGNNETGVLQPIAEAAARCDETGTLYHCDAVQAAGVVPLNVGRLGVHLLTLSAHKIGGPKGVGCLYVNHDVPLEPLIVGGSQERRRRGGTENVAAIAGFAKACELAQHRLEGEAKRLAQLRDRLEQGLLARVKDVRVNSAAAERLPHLLNIAFEGIENERLLLALDEHGVAVSTGPACSSGGADPSHVLLAMGQTHSQARSALRFSLGWTTTPAEIDHVLDVLPPLVENLRR